MLYTGGNALGRAYCLWLLTEHLGWHSTVFANDPSWPPLTDTKLMVEPASRFTKDVAQAADAIIAYQPLPDTLTRVLKISGSTPVIVDIDDPHWEGRYGFTPPGRARVFMGLLRRGRSPFAPSIARRQALGLPIITASPFVGRRWPGQIVPHVRNWTDYKKPPHTGRLTVAFVGTPRQHKGVNELRQAVAEVGDVRLIITAEPPSDALAHEDWVGTTTLEHGRHILNQSHLVAALQNDSRWTRQQSPVKVVDGMIAGRVVLGSDVPPIRWAVGNNGLLVPPGDHRATVAALQFAQANRERMELLGRRARSEAFSRFTPEAVAPVFADVVRAAIDGRG